jgi:WD40 repeat protein
VAYPDTTRLELGADTEMRLLEPESSPGETGTKVFLEEGLVSGEVAQPERRPLVLATPHAEALVRARRFSFASAADATLAETEEGRLRLTRKSDGQAIDVPTGWYVLAAARAGPLKPRQLAARITRPRVTLNDAAGPILSLSYSPTGRLLTFGGWDGIVHEGDAATGQLRRTLQGHKKSVRALAYAPDGAWLATTSDEKGANVRLWELVSGEERATFKGHRAAVHTVAFSPDGKLLASGGAGGKEGGEVRLWHVPTGASAGLLRHGPGDVLALAFSPDGLQLATAGGKENLAKVWDLTTLQPICTLTGHTQRVQAAAFSPDGKVVATGSRDGSVRLWDAVSGEVLAVLVSDARDTRALAFSPDGKRLAVTNGPLARLWDVAGRRELVTFKAHKHAVTAVRFSPDGKTLATAGWDRTVRLWDIPQSAGLPGEL